MTIKQKQAFLQLLPPHTGKTAAVALMATKESPPLAPSPPPSIKFNSSWGFLSSPDGRRGICEEVGRENGGSPSLPPSLEILLEKALLLLVERKKKKTDSCTSRIITKFGFHRTLSGIPVKDFFSRMLDGE